MSAFHARMALILALLVVLNAGAWLWCGIAFAGAPALLGIAGVVYGLGLRHAVDADHIAAIDNVTRKLMAEDGRPVSVGFWFAIGHSAVVILVTLTVIAAIGSLQPFQMFREVGGLVSTTFSALFLLAVAVMNSVIFCSILQSLARLRAGRAVDEARLDVLIGQRGFVARLLRPLFSFITRSWHMAPLGFVFGLGFDTATEVALFGLSATQVSHGVPLGTVLVFPLLFAAGMALVDTADGIVMVGAYRWALADPARKLCYNMAITLMSIVVALFIAGLEVMTLAARQFGLKGSAVNVVRLLSEHFNAMGFVIIALFVVTWLIAFAIYRVVHRAALLQPN